MTMRPPRRRTSWKPAFLKIAQSSEPDRMRNLTNGYLHLCDENLFTETSLDFFRRRRLEKKFECLTQVTRADSMVSPWLAISNSGHKETYPSPSRSITAVSFIGFSDRFLTRYQPGDKRDKRVELITKTKPSARMLDHLNLLDASLPGSIAQIQARGTGDKNGGNR